uniref:probable G-protein coupled receptor 139 n=1 Tax=Pristiophorus japonicus TaxID=55135 RepID=UPI00398F5BC1
MDWNDTTMDQNLKTVEWNVTTMDRSFISDIDSFSVYFNILSLEERIRVALLIIQYIYYPLLAALGIPANVVTIVILSRGKCGLSKCVTRYLVAMAAADLLLVILDLVLRHMPIIYRNQFISLYNLPLCNIHAVLLFAATDCSVWFTVSFTFDRFVVICCHKLKTKYCTEKTAALVLGTVSVLSGLKNIFWYFMLTNQYSLVNNPWFYDVTWAVKDSPVWTAIEFLHYILTPCLPFVVIVLLNAVTVRHIFVANRARRRLWGPSSGENSRDPEMESRRKSIIVLFVISSCSWAVFMVYCISIRMWWMGYRSVFLPDYVQEVGFGLQQLSCCTNTGIYAVTQTKFREQLKNVGKYAFTLIVKKIKR